MGAFFAIQVKKGSELLVKNLLEKFTAHIHFREKPLVKAVYACESVLHEVKLGTGTTLDEALNELNKYEVDDYLYVQKLKSLAVNLRNSYRALDKKDKLRESYSNTLKTISAKIREYAKKGIKRIKALLDGYILIEFNVFSKYMPIELYSIIQQIPNVISILSRYPVPQGEIQQFFKMAEVQTEIIEVNEEIDVEEVEIEVEKEMKDALHLLNMKKDPTAKKECERKIKLIEAKKNKIRRIKEFVFRGRNKLLQYCKLFIRKRRVSLHLSRNDLHRYGLSMFKSLFSLPT